MAANTIVTPDPSGAIHLSRIEQADAPILALGAELRENRAAVDAENDRADDLQEANPDDAETRVAAWAIRDACRPLTYRYHAILNELRDRPALTLAGMAVKSRAILEWLSPGGDEIPSESEDGRVAWSLARDVLRMAEASRHDGANPDAVLISDCEEMARLLKEANASAEDATRDEMARWEILASRIIAAPTHTSDGVLARVRALAAAHGDFGASFDYREGEPALMLAAIMHAVDPAVRVTPGVAGRAHYPSPILARGDEGLRRENASPDVELIAAWAEFEALEMGYLGLYDGPTHIEDDCERDAADAASGRRERQKALQDVIADATAMTLDGLRAKARCVVADLTDILDDQDSPVGEIGSSIIRDLVGDFHPIAIVKGGVA